MTASHFDILVGQAVRAHRGAYTYDEYAARARTCGLPWHRNTVRAVEMGNRSVTLAEAICLATMMGCSIQDLIEAPTKVAGHTVPGRQPITDPAVARNLDAEIKAARRLLVTPDEIAQRAIRLWGHSLTDERERRLNRTEGMDRRSVQALRGHVTRQLVAELRNAA